MVSLTNTRVLFVGDTNTLRSPLAAAMFRLRAGEQGVAISVASAGIRGSGEPVHANVETALTDYNLSLSAKRSERVDQPLIDGADLVLAMTCDNASAMLAMKSKRRNHIFTIREFTQLLAKAGARPPWETLEDWIERMHISRTSNYYRGDPALDLAVPESERLLDFKTLARELGRRSETIVKLALAGTSGANPSQSQPQSPSPA